VRRASQATRSPSRPSTPTPASSWPQPAESPIAVTQSPSALARRRALPPARPGSYFRTSRSIAARDAVPA